MNNTTKEPIDSLVKQIFNTLIEDYTPKEQKEIILVLKNKLRGYYGNKLEELQKQIEYHKQSVSLFENEYVIQEDDYLIQ